MYCHMKKRTTMINYSIKVTNKISINKRKENKGRDTLAKKTNQLPIKITNGIN